MSTRINDIRIGSFDEILSFYIAPALANPDVRAILQGLGTNVIWTFGSMLLTSIQASLPKPEQSLSSAIGENEREVMIEALRSGNRSVTLRIIEERQGLGRRETILQIDASPQLNSGTLQLPTSVSAKEDD